MTAGSASGCNMLLVSRGGIRRGNLHDMCHIYKSIPRQEEDGEGRRNHQGEKT